MPNLVRQGYPLTKSEQTRKGFGSIGPLQHQIWPVRAYLFVEKQIKLQYCPSWATLSQRVRKLAGGFRQWVFPPSNLAR